MCITSPRRKSRLWRPTLRLWRYAANQGAMCGSSGESSDNRLSLLAAAAEGQARSCRAAAPELPQRGPSGNLRTGDQLSVEPVSCGGAYPSTPTSEGRQQSTGGGGQQSTNQDRSGPYAWYFSVRAVARAPRFRHGDSADASAEQSPATPTRLGPQRSRAPPIPCRAAARPAQSKTQCTE